ncbi:LOW QUALITY PROTEIN: hypothetical protein ACHAXR_006128 [Thalassiosira sp. AJA248-18]
MMESSPLIHSKRAPASLLERHRALKERGVGQAAHLIKDAVFGHQDAPYEGKYGSLRMLHSLPAIIVYPQHFFDLYEPAGYYDPYKNEQSVLRNKTSVLCGRLVVHLKGAVLFSCWLLFLLSFFEPPHWCRNASDLQIVVDKEADDPTYNNSSAVREYGDCKLLFDAYGTTADEEEDQPYYPNSSSMWLTIYQSKLVELACALFISLYMALEFGDDGFEARLFFYPGYKRWTRTVQSIVLVFIITSTVFDVTIYNPFLRMSILGTFLRTFQRELWTFLKMIPEMLLPLSMLAIIVVFYAWFGAVIFYDSPQGMAAFPNLADGMWTLWICVTTAFAAMIECDNHFGNADDDTNVVACLRNYPDVMMPSFNENRGAALYFVSFMVLSFFYVMNLVLAVAVNAYDESIEERKSSRKKMTNKLLAEAFSLLDHNNDGSVPRRSIMHVMTILNQDIPEIRGLSEDDKAIMFALLDKDGDREISRAEFAQFGSILLLNLTKLSEYATFVETNLPSIFRSNFYHQFSSIVKSKRFEYSIEVVLVLNAVIVAAQDYPILAGLDMSRDPHYRDGFIDTRWEGVETIFTVVYVVEALSKIMVNGWKRYLESHRNVFDLFITGLVVLASAYVYYPNAYNNHALIEFVVMVRVLRLGRLLFSIPRFRLFGAISVEIIPAATSVFVVLLFISYLFASIGMLLYGGVITRDPTNPYALSLLEAENFVESKYWANNFNDMFSGMNVLFNWLVVNNWTTETSGLETATGNKWLVRLFFFSFYLLGVIGISNVITSFVINAFFQQMATIEHRQGPEEHIEGEATIRGSHAVFDPSNITGTETGLGHSVYFARIKPKHRDVELDEREALKRLFSRTSSSGG